MREDREEQEAVVIIHGWVTRSQVPDPHSLRDVRGRVECLFHGLWLMVYA